MNANQRAIIQAAVIQHLVKSRAETHVLLYSLNQKTDNTLRDCEELYQKLFEMQEVATLGVEDILRVQNQICFMMSVVCKLMVRQMKAVKKLSYIAKRARSVLCSPI